MGVKAIALQADVSQEDEVKSMFETAHREFGRLDIVVSNSGIEHFGDISEVKGSDIDAVFAVNVKGQYFVAQQAYRFMEDYGRVMLTSSISAVKVGYLGSSTQPWRAHADILDRVFLAMPYTLLLRQLCRV